MNEYDEQKKRDKEAEILQLQQDEDFRAVLSSAAGRRFVWRIIDIAAGAHEKSYRGEPLANAYNEGRRSTGVDLEKEAERVAKAAYVAMWLESKGAAGPGGIANTFVRDE